MSELIIVDDAGVEISRSAKGRGRPRTGAVKQADGNYIIKASVMNATKAVKAKPADYITPEYITVDATGTEIEPRTSKGRGRPKPGYTKAEDGQFKGHWVAVVIPEVKTEVIVKTEETVLA